MPNKLSSLPDLACAVASGSSISIGGFTSQRHPTALLRELIRAGVSDLHVYCHSAGSDIDLLIGAGCVRRIEGAYLADGVLAPIARNWRRFVEAGRIEFSDYSNAAMMARFSAGAMGLPFLPTLSMLGSAMLNWHINAQHGDETCIGSPELRQKAVEFDCPFSGTKTLLLPAIKTDYCLLHVQKASTSGLIRIEGQEFLDIQQALAAKHVFVTCEELVDDDELRREPERNRLPPFVVEAVAEVKYGSHPHSVHNYYDYDPAHLRRYDAAAGSAERFAAYLDEFVHGLKSHSDYVVKLGGEQYFETLRPSPNLGYNANLVRTSARS